MVYKRIRGWTSGRSHPVLNFVKYPRAGFWLLTALKDDLFPEIFRHSKEVFELIRQISGNSLFKLTRYTG